MPDISKITLPNNSSYNIKDGSAIANITRNGTTFTATKRDGTTFTFTQQDNNTTYSAGSGLSLSGTTFNHSNNVTAATAGVTSATSSVNGTIAIPYVTYDSQGHITQSGTHTHTLTGYPEAYLTWGGKNFAGSYGPIDAAMVPNLGANRLAFIKGSAVTIEYSRDAGATWTDYGAGANVNATLFGTGGSFLIGKADSTNKATANTNKYQLRVTIDTGAASVYTVLNKFVIYVSTSGSNYCTVQIQKALQSTPTTFVNETGDIDISGWSGYNVINTGGITTYGNAASSQYGRIRFIFKANGGNTNYNGLTVQKIMGFGGVGWITPSNMARDGHLYSYDSSQNATFPAHVTSTQFNGPLNGNASTATKATQDESGNNIKASYAASFSISDHTITLKNKNGASLGTVTVPDNNTTYTANTGIKLNGTTFQHTNSVTAGTAGTSSATSGSTLAVPYVTYDAQGHITGSGTHTHTVTGFLTSSSSLDASKLTGTVPTSVLPSYVDDVLEYTAKANFPATGEEGKIYVDKTTNLTWRWSGSAYVEISPSLAIGSTASTAAKGNHTHTVSHTPAGTITVTTNATTNKTATVSPASSGTATYTPAGTVSQPTFTGTQGSVSVSKSYTPAGTVAAPTFTGTKASGLTVSPASSGTATYTPAGTVSQPTFTGTAATISVSKSYTPAGTVSKPTFTGTQATISVSKSYTPAGTINTPTISLKTAASAGTAVTGTSVSNEVLSFTTGSFKNGDAAYQSNALTFTGTAATITSTGTYTPAGTVSQPTFTGTAATITSTGSYTPAGTVSQPTFTGTGKRLVLQDYTPAGTNSAPAFTGTAATITSTGNFTPSGTVSQPTFTGTGVRLVTGNIAVPNTYTATFTGTAATLTTSVPA